MIVSMRLDLPTEPAVVTVVRRQVDALLHHMSVAEEDVYRTDIVVTEACSNVVRHAYGDSPDRYCIELEYYAERIVLKITDHGSGFDLSAVPTPELGQIGGYGIYFMRRTADNVEVISDPLKGTMVLAEISLRYRDEKSLREALALDK